MARASHKADLLEDAKSGYDELIKLLNSFSENEQEGTFPFEDRDRNIRDVLVHLHEWHNMMEKWNRIGCVEKGTPAVPREGYSWKTLPDMNRMIWAQYQDVSLARAKELLDKSHNAMLAIIEGYPNDALFRRNQYPWTNETVLGSYFVSATSSHYEWAADKLKKYKKSLK